MVERCVPHSPQNRTVESSKAVPHLRQNAAMAGSGGTSGTRVPQCGQKLAPPRDTFARQLLHTTSTPLASSDTATPHTSAV